MAELQSILLYITLFVSLFFEVFLLITYLEAREEIIRDKDLGKNISKFPSVTIIVPCFNEEKTVGATIESILALDYPKEKLSIMAVNDGSTDGTLKALSAFKSHPQVSVFSKENGGKHSALNFALERIDSELVGCLDADSFVSTDALRKITPLFESEDIMAVTPSIRVHEPKTLLQHVQKVEYSWGIFLRRLLSSLGALYVTPGPFSIFRTKVFREIGGYRHAHHTEDLEMALRMQKNRYRIVNSHGAHVFTKTPPKFRGLFKQRLRWTYGFLNNAIDYREMFFNKKYGHIGMFILPIAIFSMFSTLFLVANVIWSNISKLSEAFVKYQTVGWNFNPSMPSFDWFFLPAGTVTFLTLTAVMLSIVILYNALKLAEGKARFSKGVLLYLTVYVFIVPLWLARAIASTALGKDITWR